MDIDEFVALSVKHNASDLHLCAGHPPMLRIDGELQPLAAASTLTAQGVQALCDGLLSAQQRESLRRLGQIDLALHRPGGERLRANVFQQSAGMFSHCAASPGRRLRLPSWRRRPSSRRCCGATTGFFWSPAPPAAASPPRWRR